ncbi:MAG: biotin--[Ruminococcus sp.]|nr:biotin--[acetyl-CoA-carboxylase] ligase [Ruminococcus sp.]
MKVKNALLSALAGAGEGYISGFALAAQLGVSRSAVWKAVKALEAEGYTIESVTAKGYRLSGDNDRLSAELIGKALHTEKLGRELFVHDEIGSTNTAAKELAGQGAPHGTTVVADRQTAGRGRMGRSFVSPSGTGIYMSIVIRPEFGIELAPMMTSAAACAVAKAVERLSGSPTQIKWVNDVYMAGRKICGILTEASFGLEAKTLDYAVIGIGINVRSVKTTLDEELRAVATSVEDACGARLDRSRLCGEVLCQLERYLGMIENGGFLADYRRRELLTGNRITANVGARPIEGEAIGIDDSANLIVRLDSGEEVHLSSGEASLCRIKGR